MKTVDTVSLEDTMADTNNFVVERKNSDVKAENSGAEELKSNSESDRQQPKWIRKIRSGLTARSGQNAVGHVPIIKLPALLRKPVECYTPRQWQFGLHNRDPQASSSESEDLKISVAAAFKLNPVEWDKFCADVVDNPADMMLKSYGIYSGVSELSPKEVQYLLTLDALTLVLVLCSLWREAQTLISPDQENQLPNLFIDSLVAGGFNIEALVKYGVACWGIVSDLFLCENQIPMALMKKAISKCYRLLPEERNSNDHALRELENPDSNVTKKLLDMILKSVVFLACNFFFAEPCPDKEDKLGGFIDNNFEVGELGNCAHVFACFHKVITSCVESTTADKKLSATDTENFASDVNQQLETDVEIPAEVRTPPRAVTTTCAGAEQSFLRAVATSSKQLANVIATIIRFSKKTATEEHVAFFPVIPSATDLKKAGLRIKGIPGMLQQVAFKDGCLFLPIISQSETKESYIRNMVVYEYSNMSAPFPCTEYLLLMSHLIKTPEDVAYLVDCDVLRAYLGTKQSIFQMWERLQSGLFFGDYSDEYIKNIVNPINKHCASTLNVMITDFYSTFCSKPWLVISVISAIMLLVATLIQTYVLVISSDKMQPHFPRGG